MIYKIQKVTPLEDILILQRVAEMEQERYSKSGDYSVTDLVNPPRVVHLKKRYGHKVTPRLDTSISSMMGTGMHEYFEKYLDLWCDKYNYDGYSLEEQVKVSWDTMIDGKVETRLISGRYDIREGKDLYDLKTAKVWKLIFDPNLEEYHEQQNFYSHLIKINKDISLDTVNIVALYKDWQEGNALRDRNYPQQQMMQYQLTKWPDVETEKLISLRLKRLVENENVKDEDLPLCSRKERWERHQGGETVHYAILKNRKAKRATKVVRGGTLDDAMVIANGMKGMTKDSVIEVRYAFPKRCAKYCDTNEFCSFWKEWNEKNKKGIVNDYFTFKV
jgi:hypothetical protein